MSQERANPSFESLESVRTAAKSAGIDTTQMTMDQVKVAVTDVGEQIASSHEKFLPRNYRRVKAPPFISPLAISVAVIMIDGLKK